MSPSFRRRPTLAAGAVIQRDLVQRHIRREIRKAPQLSMTMREQIGFRYALNRLRRWLKLELTRAKRKGGIGR